jgi:MFS family permease
MPNIAPWWLTFRLKPRKFRPAVDTAFYPPKSPTLFIPDSRRAWTRLATAVLIGSLGSVGMWSVVVALPVVQTEFAASRGTASLAFTMVFLGFGSGGVLTGKIADRYGIVAAIAVGVGILGLGYIGAAMSSSIWQFIFVHFAIGLSSSATFGPLMAEASHWFDRYRGLAVALAASGNYIGGTIWPPIVNWGIQSAGWRTTHIIIGIFTAIAMTLALGVLRMLMGAGTRRSHIDAPPPGVDLRLSTNSLTAILSLASISCCVAMSMPQVHIVAYCGDLGYGVARGAEMLSLMLDSALSAGSARASLPIRSAASARFLSARSRKLRRCCSICSSTASLRSTSSRRCSACFRAVLCLATPSLFARRCRQRRPRPASASSSSLPFSGCRSAAGFPA